MCATVFHFLRFPTSLVIQSARPRGWRLWLMQAVSARPARRVS
uniref:Uncharacterized protein n=1 Tax=Myoviridae sp. ctpjm1 TaxID=2826699 RepID=A0A8S5NNZ5_9CAUD|nr:MAG TPA: hypothetical protein [Myoviridae sp. ctpjm1]